MLAIANSEECCLKFQNQSCDVKVKGGKSEDSLSLSDPMGPPNYVHC